MEGELREELTSVYKTVAMVSGRRVHRERGTPPPCHRRVPDAQGGGALELSDSFEPERFALEGTPVAGRRLNTPPPEHWTSFKTPSRGDRNETDAQTDVPPASNRGRNLRSKTR